MSDMIESVPILEYDPARDAVLEPSRIIKRGTPPACCVLCYFGEVVQERCAGASVLRKHRWEHTTHILYQLEYEGSSVAVMVPGVGAPLAAGLLEEIIAFGCKKFVVCGGCGVLRNDIAMGDVLLVESALRDEGTSYHYLPAGREVVVPAETVTVLAQLLEQRGVPFTRCKSWTNDGIYRETPEKIGWRRDEGCLCVEMEASALLAVAQFRGVELGYLLYGGDDVSGEAGQWENRGWRHNRSVRDALFTLAIEACLELEKR